MFKAILPATTIQNIIMNNNDEKMHIGIRAPSVRKVFIYMY